MVAVSDVGPDRPWLEADTLRDAVELLHTDVSRASDSHDEWFARQLEAILEQHEGSHE